MPWRRGARGAEEVGAPGGGEHRRAQALRHLGDPGSAIAGRGIGYVPQQEHPDHRQQESAREEEEPGVAERSFRRALNLGVSS